MKLLINYHPCVWIKKTRDEKGCLGVKSSVLGRIPTLSHTAFIFHPQALDC